MDATNSFFPMDLGAMAMQTDETNNPPTSQAHQGNTNPFSLGGMGNGGVFMGVSSFPTFSDQN